MNPLKNEDQYLKRLAAPLAEKIRVARHISLETGAILDVGCADGTVTVELARVFPEARIYGIDLNHNFINRAKARAEEAKTQNVRFERIYLRDLLGREERYGVITFISALHEFFSYGEGISSVIKALADADELLLPGGRLIIRDMAAPAYFQKICAEPSARKKVIAREDLRPYVQSFEERYGSIDNLLALNHFLLKYLYTDNWEYELKENYVGVSLEEYQQIFTLLGMRVLHVETYLIPYLRNRWKEDFGFEEAELDKLVSTTILVAEKKVPAIRTPE